MFAVMEIYNAEVESFVFVNAQCGKSVLYLHL